MNIPSGKDDRNLTFYKHLFIEPEDMRRQDGHNIIVASKISKKRTIQLSGSADFGRQAISPISQHAKNRGSSGIQEGPPNPDKPEPKV